MTVYDKIVYIIDGGKYGNGNITFFVSEYTNKWQEGGASCGLQNRTITAIKNEHRGKRVKFVTIKLPSLPK